MNKERERIKTRRERRKENMKIKGESSRKPHSKRKPPLPRISVPRAHRSTGLQHRYYATAADFAELYGSAVQDGNPNGAKRFGAFIGGSFTPLSGYAFGPGRNTVALTADNKVTNADPNTNGAVFLPTGGHRDVNYGAVHNIGSHGNYWSATAATSGNGHYLAFNFSSIYPQASALRPHALPVRCIRD